MELWDIMDAAGNRTGRTIERGKSLKDGEYHLAAHIYIVNGSGEFLIQKRSLKKDIWPGQWDITGGAVISGEDSCEGAIREVEEELGIKLKTEDITHMTRLHRKRCIIDVWLAFADVSVDEVIMQDGEVDEVRFVTAEEMIDTIFKAEFRDDEYMKTIQNYIIDNQL